MITYVIFRCDTNYESCDQHLQLVGKENDVAEVVDLLNSSNEQEEENKFDYIEIDNWNYWKTTVAA